MKTRDARYIVLYQSEILIYFYRLSITINYISNLSCEDTKSEPLNWYIIVPAYFPFLAFRFLANLHWVDTFIQSDLYCTQDIFFNDSILIYLDKVEFSVSVLILKVLKVLPRSLLLKPKVLNYILLYVKVF